MVILFRFCPTLFIVASAFTTASASNHDTLYWSRNNRITWADFRGAPNKGSINGATSATGIIYSYRWSNGNILADTDAYFLRSRSWKKVNQDLNILQHEQLHFDITRFHALRLKRALENIRTTPANLHYAVQLVVDRIFEEKDEMQRKYDVETRHGSRLKQQAEWNRQLDDWISDF